jgi:hypothetical protein
MRAFARDAQRLDCRPSWCSDLRRRPCRVGWESAVEQGFAPRPEALNPFREGADRQGDDALEELIGQSSRKA